MKLNCGTYSKGFTLIELLVVISIIALLMAVMMPALGKARESAKTVVCKTNLKQMGYGVNLYANDHSDFMPPSWVNNDNSPSTNNFMAKISPYLGEREDETLGNDFFEKDQMGNKVWMCPAFKNPEKDSGGKNSTAIYSYAMNSHLSFDIPSDSIAWYIKMIKRDPNWAKSLRMSRIQSPDTKVLVGDSIGWHVSFTVRELQYVLADKETDPTIPDSATRHSGKTNVLMAGMNVEQDFADPELKNSTPVKWQFKKYPNIFPGNSIPALYR